MKKRSKILSFILAIILVIACIPVQVTAKNTDIEKNKGGGLYIFR